MRRVRLSAFSFITFFPPTISSHFFHCVGNPLLQQKLQALEQELHVTEALVLLEDLLKIFNFKLCINCFFLRL